MARIDRWLSAARVFRSRTAAARACEAGDVLVNGTAAKPSRAVAAGDTVEVEAPRGHVVLVVVAVADKRLGPAAARALYEDRSPPPPPREERVAVRERGAGRPTKADRRAIERLRRGW
jgi:ribosome-associated heat shock protein Hsp15